MKAVHDEKKNVDSLEMLIELASTLASLPEKLTRMFLENTELATTDVMEEAEANTGLQGVPYLILGRKDDPRRKIIFSGVEPASTIIEAMKSVYS